MRFGIRVPSLKKRLSARLSVKRQLVHRLGLKAPRGMCGLRNPKRCLYNVIYHRSPISLANPPKNKNGDNESKLKQNGWLTLSYSQKQNKVKGFLKVLGIFLIVIGFFLMFISWFNLIILAIGIYLVFFK